MSALPIMNRKYLSYEVLRAKNSLESTELGPIECEKNNTIDDHDTEYASKKCETTCEIILEMYTGECPSKETNSDNIFPKNRPTETRSKFACLTKRKTPYKYPTYTTRKS